MRVPAAASNGKPDTNIEAPKTVGAACTAARVDLARACRTTDSVPCHRTICGRDGRGGLILDAEAALDGREERGPLRAGILARDLQACRGGLDVGIGLQRRFDQAVELGRLEHAPPLAGDIEALHDALRFAAIDAAGDEVGRGVGQVGFGLGRIGAREVGPSVQPANATLQASVPSLRSIGRSGVLGGSAALQSRSSFGLPHSRSGSGEPRSQLMNDEATHHDGSVTAAGAGGFLRPSAREQADRSRQHGEEQQRREQHAADHDDRQRLLHLAADRGRERGRQQADAGGDAGHQHRPHLQRAGRAQRRLALEARHRSGGCSSSSTMMPSIAAMPNRATKPIAAEMLNGMPASEQREHAADHRHRDRAAGQQGVARAMPKLT